MSGILACLRRAIPAVVPGVCFIAACSGVVEVITPPPPPAASFVVTLAPDPADVAAAAALGWESGIPGAEVTLTPTEPSGPPQAFTTSAEGTISVADLAQGQYLVEARRLLTDAERSVLPSTDDALGFVARDPIQATGSDGKATVFARASRRRGLMVSEWAFNNKAVPGFGTYQYSGFIELINNADSTIYLDGIVIGEAYNAALDAPTFTCAMSAAFLTDPAGVWTRLFQRFPGPGQSYPLAPGDRVVVATDAIDHRTLFPGAIDLTAADFEFVGPNDVDNPAVPNMVDLGLIAHDHGLMFPGLAIGAVVSLPVDPLVMDRMKTASGRVEYARIPRDRILDVLTIGSNYPADFPMCPEIVSRQLDRKFSTARGLDEVAEYEFSLHRTSIGFSNGRVRLQHSLSSDADFVRGARTPGAAAPTSGAPMP